MILLTGTSAPRSLPAQIADYLWGGFSALCGLALFFAVWHLAALRLDPLVLPSPSQTLITAWEILKAIKDQELLQTLYRAGIGFVIASFIGIFCGLIAGGFKTLAVLLRPLMTLLLGMPPIIWIVLSIFWFGMTDTGIVFTIVLASLPLTFAASMRAMLNLPKELTEMARVYHLPLTRRIRAVYLPALSQYLLPALIVAAGSGVKITLMAELIIGSAGGLGERLADARAMLNADDIMALVLLAVAIIMIIEYLILEPLRRLITPWQN